jgi:hypothetical protein
VEARVGSHRFPARAIPLYDKETLMALTINRVTGLRDESVGSQRMLTRHVTFDNSYATGGESLKPADVGLRQISNVIPVGAARKTDATSAVNVSYDHTNQKLVAYNSAAAGAAPTEVANATDLSTYTARVLVFGK